MLDMKREEEEEEGFSYQPSDDSGNVESDQTKFEEEDEEEEQKMEEAYKSVLRKHAPDTTRTMSKALAWLEKKFPNMPLAQARKAAGEMTETLGEVNAPQKISKEQKPPEVDYGKYGEPDVVAPLSTFSAQIQNAVTKAVAEQTDEMVEVVKKTLMRYGAKNVVRKGFGPEQTVRDKNLPDGSSEYADESIEGQLQSMLGGM